MMLVLEIQGERAGSLGTDGRYVFKAAGGTIGRAVDNTLVLPSPLVSARHARIDYSGGGYSLTDVSTNGISWQESSRKLEPTRAYRLRNHDTFVLGEFEIRATLLNEDGSPLE